MPKHSDEVRTKCIGSRTTPAEYEALQRASTDHRLTVSGMIMEILLNWLREKGYLPR